MSEEIIILATLMSFKATGTVGIHTYRNKYIIVSIYRALEGGQRSSQKVSYCYI